MNRKLGETQQPNADTATSKSPVISNVLWLYFTLSTPRRSAKTTPTREPMVLICPIIATDWLKV
jgi:hypothetical protein